MASRIYKLHSKILVYPGMGGWRFLALPIKESKEIKETYGKPAKGWGSLRVLVSIGKTKWKTSIFPDKQSGTYLLPLKKEIRKAEDIDDDAVVRFALELL